jgi:(S)-mandelate dehydrogenase
MNNSEAKTSARADAVPRPAAEPKQTARYIAKARSIEDLRLLARRRLPRSVFDFFDGGAEDERTLNANREAFGKVRLAPKVLVDVSKVDTSTEILGVRCALPVLVGPTGAAGFGWPRADVAIARAAAGHGIPYTLSTSATASIERIAQEAGGNLLFQAYILKQREFTERLIERARAAGYFGLMITVDLPVGGKRERDYRNDFGIPFRFTRRNVADFSLRPGWVARMLINGLPAFENLAGLSPSSNLAQAASSVGRNYDPSFDWDDLKAIRDLWPGKLVVKGVVRPDDVERLAAIGCDAVIVSNHGGRQLDSGPASLEALPGVVAARGHMSVMMDGGIRRGSDIVKALALGADAVLIGRATLYGACAGGEGGAVRALDILKEELTRTMQLCGARSPTEIDQGLVWRDAPRNLP